MADTKRSLADIYALLADNTAGDISAQDMRDVVATLQPDHGEVSITATSATTISDTTSYFQIAGTYALSADAMDWDMNTNGQLRYIGAADRVAHIALSCSMTSGSSNQVIYMGVAKGGTIITPSIVQRKIGTGADVGSAATHAFIEVSTNDYLTGVVRNTTAANDVTFETLNLFAMGMAK